MRVIAYIVLALIALFCTGYRTTKYVPVEVKNDSIYIERVKNIYIPPDSAQISALLECDSLGRVRVKKLETAQSENAVLRFSLDSLGCLLAAFKTNPDTVFVPQIEIKTVTSKPVEIEKQLSRWQIIKLEVGGWAVGAVALLLGLLVVRLIR